jgi:uncharacterized membrane protein YczE
VYVGGENMRELKKDIKRLPITMVGFVFLSIGIMLTKRSSLGMSPWGVFHQGLSNVTGLSFGVITQLIGLIILLISVLVLKTKVGLGTVLNVLLVGLMIDWVDETYQYIPTSYSSKALVFTIGLFTMTFGRSLYIASRLGAGPRDGLFVGLSRILNIQVKYVKPSIEITVLFFGFLLGGVVGLGTVVAALTSGYLVQMFFAIFRYDSSNHTQSNIFNYIHKEGSSL